MDPTVLKNDKLNLTVKSAADLSCESFHCEFFVIFLANSFIRSTFISLVSVINGKLSNLGSNLLSVSFAGGFKQSCLYFRLKTCELSDNF